jgi:hypothetical protein
MLISFAVLAWAMARADEPFVRVATGMRSGYIVPEAYAEAHESELMGSLTGPPKVEGFWTPTEANVVMAERVLRERVEDAAKDPTLLFPELANSTDSTSLDQIHNEKVELELIVQNYESYQRQYVGLIIKGNKVVYCNYSDGTTVDPSRNYVFIQKVFDDSGRIHFLQAQVDAGTKVCSNVSFIGSRQK